MRNKIICKLIGGLGNQLFQYAFAKNLARKYNLELRFDISNNDFSSLKKGFH